VLSFDAFLADDTMFDNKSLNFYLKHNYHIFVLHCLSNNATYENMRMWSIKKAVVSAKETSDRNPRNFLFLIRWLFRHLFHFRDRSEITKAPRTAPRSSFSITTCWLPRSKCYHVRHGKTLYQSRIGSMFNRCPAVVSI
jgi:hypothetical protein